MSNHRDSAFDLCELLKRRAPELLDLVSAQTDEQFEVAFDALLQRAVAHLEQNKTLFESLNEEGLSAVFAGSLSTFGLVVTREAHSNGHVDITIDANYCLPARRKLSEAKIYHGPKKHLDGMKQLLGRYTTGREGRGLLIEYVRDNNITELVKKIREKMDNELPMKQKGGTVNHSLGWSFVSTHTHNCGKDLQVCHIGCNLYISDKTVS